MNLLESDAGRIRNESSGLDVSAKERLARVSEILAHSGDYRKDYESFVMALSYARDDERPGYDEGVEALRNLANLIFV